MPDLLLDTRAVVEDLRSFIVDEFAAQSQAHAEQMALSVDERVELGVCIKELSFLRTEDGGRILFAYAGNDSKFREGDVVSLHHPTINERSNCVIYREEKCELWLKGTSPFNTSIFTEAREGWLLDEEFVDLKRFYLEALDRLPSSAIGQECILPLLAGKAEPALDEVTYAEIYEELAAKQPLWEDAQREAIAGCLAADHCYLVQGPPGTGKTRVLAQVVQMLVARGERVLITAFTHRAIDHALVASAREIGDRDRVARFRDPIHRRDEGFDTYAHYAESPLAKITGGWVAAATPFALRKRLRGIEFDAIVMDEAGQMTTALAIMAMLSGRKYLFFGDQQQLGPVILSRPRRDARFMGIFHALKSQELLGTRLDVSYRLNCALAEWPSEQFYLGELKSAPAAAGRRLAWSPATPIDPWIAEALDPQSPLVWLRIDHDQARGVSNSETAVAAALMLALWKSGVRMEEMALITPFRRQARRIRQRLETLAPLESWRECLFDTVERMQGQEREVIVLSLCASEASFIHRIADFLFDPRRLNVSATRARTKLVVLASDSLVKFHSDDTDLQEDIALLRSLQAAATVLSPPSLHEE